MNFSYKWLQSFFKKKLPAPKALADLLTLHFAEVEEIKKEKGDYVLSIDVRPNRAGDCFSHQGVAREISTITGLSFLEPSLKALQEDKKIKAKDFISLEVKDKNACPRYTARVIKDVKVRPSPQWLKERLRSCGLRPINNIVDVANYIMLETGQPFHAFDAEKLEGNKIIVRYARNKERIVTLDEQKFDLDSDILVIADERKPVAIAGIKGGKLPEIDSRTKVVVLESANFNPQVIRRSSKRINLRTDASLRFEHGIDPNLTEPAVNLAAVLIQKLAGGKVASGLVDFYPRQVFPKRIRLDLKYLNNLLGLEIPKQEAIKILKNLGFRIVEDRPQQLLVEIPTRRVDVSIPEDLVEEIGRIYGYDKIRAVFPRSLLIPPERNLDIFWQDMARDILKEAGFSEVYNYSFFGDKEVKTFGYEPKNLLQLENPLSQEQKYLRASLIPGLLKNLEKNYRHFPEVRIFEMGKIFRKTKAEEEKTMLSALISGERFYQIKGTVDLLFGKLGIASLWFAEPSAHLAPHPAKRDSAYAASIWHPQKCAEIKVGNEEVGFLGEISPRILGSFDFKGKVTLFDIDFEKLSRISSEEHEYRPISRFPSAIRDIAVLVPRTVQAEEVLNNIETAGGKIIRDIDLFDIYEGEELPQGKKNFAFHIIFQAEDRTLSAKEIDEVQNKIIKALELKPGWQVRKK